MSRRTFSTGFGLEIQSAHQGTFAPRRVYGDYLEDLLGDSIKRSNTRIEIERDEVVDLELDDHRHGCA